MPLKRYISMDTGLRFSRMMKMSIRNKIFLLCMILCVAVLTVSGVIIIEKIHSDMLDKEIENMINFDKGINIVLSTYIINIEENERLKGKSSVEVYDPIYPNEIRLVNFIEHYLNQIDSKDIYFEVFDNNRNSLVSTHENIIRVGREEIDYAKNGNRNYALKKYNDKYFVYVNSALKTNQSDGIVMSSIKDVSYIMKSRKEQYRFFFWIVMFSILLLSITIRIFSRFITKPLEVLTQTTKSIANGKYEQRVNISSTDEIGVLAEQFDSMAEQIECNVKELEEQGKAKQRFIDNLTHELRTPLTSIIGYADLLRKNEYDQYLFNKGLNHIYTEGKRLNELTQKMLNVVLLRKDNPDIRDENIMRILEEVIEVTRIKLNAKKISVVIDTSDMVISVDKNLIKAVLINLVDNAIKASSIGQRIFMGTKMIDNNKCIYVQDAGKGINEDELEKIMEPFYMVDKSRNRKNGGMGLGLSICDEIIKLHDAKLNIKSKANEGTIAEIIF